MTVEELQKRCTDMFGWNWQHKLAERLGVNSRTVRRWVAEKTPVPSWMEAALTGIEYENAKGKSLPTEEKEGENIEERLTAVSNLNMEKLSRFLTKYAKSMKPENF